MAHTFQTGESGRPRPVAGPAFQLEHKERGNRWIDNAPSSELLTFARRAAGVPPRVAPGTSISPALGDLDERQGATHINSS